MGLGIIGLTAAIIAVLVTPAVRAVATRFRTFDRPGGRNANTASVPRLGGVSLFIAWAGALALAGVSGFRVLGVPAQPAQLTPILVGGLVVFVVGFWDDVHSLAPAPKILGEVIAAAIVIGAGVTIERVTIAGVTYHLGWLATAFTVLWIVGLTNAFNLLDGLDGLATGLAIIAGGTCTVIVILRGEHAAAVVLVALLGALIGFLPYNFNPASIFLGDSGSLVAGFVLAVTSITGWQKGATALAAGIPILIFALPIVDVLSAIARRVLPSTIAGAVDVSVLRRILRPDRGHIHHSLIELGLSQRAAVLLLYGVALGLSALALVTMQR
jgi:UDP-GlcNAc:undecaprenyl-phosphate GlcNAc-1-phosphate transferase